jgi:hypothetical protein
MESFGGDLSYLPLQAFVFAEVLDEVLDDDRLPAGDAELALADGEAP